MPTWNKVEHQGQLSSSRTTADEKTATEVYVAVSATPTTPAAAQTASAGDTIPAGGSAHPDDPTLKVVEINARPDPNSWRTVFTVEVIYSNRAVGDLAGFEDPLDRPDEVSFEGDSEFVKFFLDEHTTQLPIINSAHDKFEEFQERRQGHLHLVIEGNRASLDPAIAASFLFPACSQNDAAFTVRGLTIGTGEGLMVAISATPQIENGIEFLRVRWVVDVAPDHDLHIDSRGYYQLVSGVRQQIMDPAHPALGVTDPWPLDNTGAKMVAKNSIPYVMTFFRYPENDFDVWGWTP